MKGGGCEADAGKPKVGERLDGGGIAEGSAYAMVGVDDCVAVRMLSRRAQERIRLGILTISYVGNRVHELGNVACDDVILLSITSRISRRVQSSELQTLHGVQKGNNRLDHNRQRVRSGEEPALDDRD